MTYEAIDYNDPLHILMAQEGDEDDRESLWDAGSCVSLNPFQIRASVRTARLKKRRKISRLQRGFPGVGVVAGADCHGGFPSVSWGAS